MSICTMAPSQSRLLFQSSHSVLYLMLRYAANQSLYWCQVRHSVSPRPAQFRLQLYLNTQHSESQLLTSMTEMIEQLRDRVQFRDVFLTQDVAPDRSAVLSEMPVESVMTANIPR